MEDVIQMRHLIRVLFLFTKPVDNFVDSYSDTSSRLANSKGFPYFAYFLSIRNAQLIQSVIVS
jgi:hypothetical protein